MEIHGARIHITGVVQGVGFRPFVYGLAQRLNLTGWVRNTSAGVDIEVDGQPETLRAFTAALQLEAPPLAHIDSIQVIERQSDGFTSFEIIHSEPIAGAFQPISPDVSICPDCLRELFDPADRRYRYPFINCTNCGPRFTIIEDIPYDRPNTTMSTFVMCPDCAAEYLNPLDRRFHAQPVACPVCGPGVWLEFNNELSALIHPKQADGDQQFYSEAAIQKTRELLRQGYIVAIKGLGGFHLACDATNQESVNKLRLRKLRVDKPFALMMANLEIVTKHCSINSEEQALLESYERPIVILQRRPDSSITQLVAPGQLTLGVMLPYTPLHYLLLEPAPDFPDALVMTSGNLIEEPIATSNEEARQRLSNLADAFLFHNRQIRTRCDDSVLRTLPAVIQTNPAGNKPESKTQKQPRKSQKESKSNAYHLRRSRGYAPGPIHLPWETMPLLATGPELKNTFCLTKGQYAFLSHHIGDMENRETMQAFEDGVAHFERLFRVQPEALAYDLHPDYLATRYALERAKRESLPAIGVQHHHAHIAACMAEHGLDGSQPIIGVSFDGTGYGEEGHGFGAIWGGEFLVATYTGYQRPYHLAYVPLPGGDRAVKEPWRIALAWLNQAGISWDDDLPPVKHALHTPFPVSNPLDIIHHQLISGLNTPLTSSMGRLFDGVASLIGVRHMVNYEAQAAIELEAIIDVDEDHYYPFDVTNGVVDASPAVQLMVQDLRAGKSAPSMAAKFHNGIAHMVAETCGRIRSTYGLKEIVLSGGVWQNIALLKRTVELLQRRDFFIYLHHLVPANDGGLALGQAVVAYKKLSQL